MGNRVRAVRSGVTIKYIYDTSGNLLAEADTNNVIQRYYIYGNGLMAMVTSGGQLYCYHYNATGSTIAITDSSQNIVNKYVYTPFGEIGNEVEAFAQPFKYVGQHGVMSESNGLYYMRARYYDPTLGRFLSEDPLGFGGGDINLYVYVGNNPVLLIDPSGLWTVAVGGSGTIQVIGAIGIDVGYAFGYSAEKGFTHGPVGSINAGIGTPSGFAGGFLQVTNASSVDDLKGFSVQVGGGVNLGASIGLDYVAGLDMSSFTNMVTKPTYEGFQFNFGAGFSPTVAEIHGLLGGTAGYAFGKDSGSCKTK